MGGAGRRLPLFSEDTLSTAFCVRLAFHLSTPITAARLGAAILYLHPSKLNDVFCTVVLIY